MVKLQPSKLAMRVRFPLPALTLVSVIMGAESHNTSTDLHLSGNVRPRVTRNVFGRSRREIARNPIRHFLRSGLRSSSVRICPKSSRSRARVHAPLWATSGGRRMIAGVLLGLRSSAGSSQVRSCLFALSCSGFCSFRLLRRRPFIPAGGDFRVKLGVRLENISSVLLLPVFFAFSGLRTEIGLLHTRVDWPICLLVIAACDHRQAAGSSLVARLTGMGGPIPPARHLNEHSRPDGADCPQPRLRIAHSLPAVFSMLVIMALVTTIMTGPLLSVFGSRRRP